MPIEIVDIPIDSMLIFHSELLVYQRVCESKMPCYHAISQKHRAQATLL
jgi:hypothetical protein